MPIESTFQHLATQCRKQRDNLSELQITIAEDRPLHGIVKLVDKLGESSEDALGDAEESLSAAIEAQQVVAQTTDLGNVRRALKSLAVCQTGVNRLQQRFFTELVCYPTIDDIVSFGRKRGGEWQAWANLVRQTLDRCQRQLFDTQQSLFQCWQEIAERAIPNAESPPAVNESRKIVLIKDHRPEQRNAS